MKEVPLDTKTPHSLRGLSSVDRTRFKADGCGEAPEANPSKFVRGRGERLRLPGYSPGAQRDLTAGVPSTDAQIDLLERAEPFGINIVGEEPAMS